MRKGSVRSGLIRRGDYIYFPDKENPALLELEWYLKAIKNIKEHVEIDKFIILSNDKYYAKDVFSKYEEMVFYFNNVLNDFLLMTKCKYGILSPSTFSWGPGRLNLIDATGSLKSSRDLKATHGAPGHLYSSPKLIIFGWH